MSARDEPTASLRDRIIPWYFVMAFVLVAGVNAIFVTLAINSNSGVVTENPYKKGLEYNQAIKKADIQDKLGWKSNINYIKNTISLTLTNKQNKAIEGAIVKAYISRPIESGYEFTLALQEQESGKYQTKVDFPLPGQWEIKVNAIWKNQHYQKRKRLVAR